MRSSLILKEPWVWNATNCESKCNWTRVAHATRTAWSPNNTALYSTLLLEALNPSHIAIRVSSMKGDTRSIPTPLPPAPTDPSIKTYHTGYAPFAISESINSRFNNSAKKFVKAWAFMAVLDWYYMSYSLSSTVHLANYPEKLGLVNTHPNSLLVSTTTRCARKYGCSFWVVSTKI